MTPEGRFSAAVQLVAAMEAQPRRPADAVATEWFRARRYVGSSDRRDVAARVWGVVRERLRLDWHLAERAGVAAPAPPRLLVAAHARLVEGLRAAEVAHAFSGGPHAEPPLTREESRALNALRPPLLPPDMPEGPRLNLPAWALPGLRARFGDALAGEAEALCGTAPMDLRANALRGTRETAAASLAAEGIATTPTPLSPWGLRSPERRVILATRAYREGLVEVQDEGSQLIALLVGARPGMRVADYCAGAAGKTLAMAATMANKGRVTACDVSATRLAGAAKRLARAGVNNAETHLLAPGDRWAKRRAGGFDRVLVDAPCTGTGTWRRNPDARVRMGESDLAELRAKQKDILDDAAPLVRPGGRLIYATCSLLPEEDEDQVTDLLRRRPDFRVVPLADAWAEAAPAGTPPPPGEGPHMTLSPRAHGTDGFFCAVLERAGEAAA